MAENLKKVPRRGILKQSNSFEQSGEESVAKYVNWIFFHPGLKLILRNEEKNFY